MAGIPDDYSAPRRSLLEIEEVMDGWRSRAGYLPDDSIVVEGFMAALRISLPIREKSKMMGADSYALASEKAIFATSEMSKGIRLKDPEWIYVWGHEVGHLALHRGAGPKAKIAGAGNRELKFIPIEESAERQAWMAARALFLPRSVLGRIDDVDEAARDVGIPIRAVLERQAEVAAFETKNKPRKRLEYRLPLVKETADEAVKLRVWEAAAKFPDEDPRVFRNARGFKIKWSDYRMLPSESQYGWCIWAGEARSFMDVQGG